MKIGSIDIGGSSVKSAAVEVADADASVVGEVRTDVLPSNQFEDLKGIVRAVAESLVAESGVEWIGISTTGSVDRDGRVVSAGHFDGYKDVLWQDYLSGVVQADNVVTTNDGRASAWAEHKLDAGNRTSIVHAVAGTGIGGGIVYEGRLLLGDSGQSGYLGHLKVAKTSELECSCGKRGCVESLSATPELTRLWSEASGDRSATIQGLIEATSAGEMHALDCWRTVGRWLGVGIGNAMNVTNPALVTVGGGVVQASIEAFSKKPDNEYINSIVDGAKYAAHRRVFAAAEIRPAQLGNDGGLVGAALLAARGA